MVPKFKCAITRIRNVVSIFCHFPELGISEGQSQEPTYLWLERMPTQGLSLHSTVSLSVKKETERGRRRYHHIKMRQQISFPPKLYSDRDFFIQLHASSPSFCIIMQSIRCTAQIWNPCTENATRQKCHSMDIGPYHSCCTSLLPPSV